MSTGQLQAEEEVISSEVVSAYLTEYQSIWSEVHARFENQRQAFNFLITILAASVTIIFSSEIQIAPQVFFWFPLVIGPLGFIFFDNELMIWAIVRYTRDHLHKKVSTGLKNPNLLALELSRFSGAPKGAHWCHRTLSFGRWLLFLVPSFVSVGYAWSKTPNLLDSYYPYLIAADSIVILVLLWSIVQAVLERTNLWHRSS